jgi:S-adenosylmethionine hydrolase
LGIEDLREIDETKNRREGSEQSYTFHGRDVYAYTAARLAAGVISFEEVGKLLKPEIVKLPYQEAAMEGPVIKGTIAVLDVQYGNIWTNISSGLFREFDAKFGTMINVKIFHKKTKVYDGNMPYAATFGAVANGKPLLYLNSLMQVSFALNMGNFAGKYKISSGGEWSVELRKK